MSRVKVVIAVVIVALLATGMYFNAGKLSNNARVDPPEVGRLYEVMLHQENAKFQVQLLDGTLANEDRQVVVVVFVGKDHGAQPPQYVPRDLVFQDKTIPIGHGKWVFVKYPVVEGIDYEGRKEFHYNGELGAQRQPYPQGTPRS